VTIGCLHHCREKDYWLCAATLSESPAEAETVHSGKPDIKHVQVEWVSTVESQGFGGRFNRGNLVIVTCLGQKRPQHFSRITIILDYKDPLRHTAPF
jgi:hypothetical protein